jgi:methylmalonyl-CoA mutase cobalamin-binding subunit
LPARGEYDVERKGARMKAEEYNLDFTVTLTPEDAKFTDEAVAAGVPLIVVCMFRDALRKLVAAEREACAKTAMELLFVYIGSYPINEQFADAIRARGEHGSN